MKRRVRSSSAPLPSRSTRSTVPTHCSTAHGFGIGAAAHALWNDIPKTPGPQEYEALSAYLRKPRVFAFGRSTRDGCARAYGGHGVPQVAEVMSDTPGPATYSVSSVVREKVPTPLFMARSVKKRRRPKATKQGLTRPTGDKKTKADEYVAVPTTLMNRALCIGVRRELGHVYLGRGFPQFRRPDYEPPLPAPTSTLSQRAAHFGVVRPGEDGRQTLTHPQEPRNADDMSTADKQTGDKSLEVAQDHMSDSLQRKGQRGRQTGTFDALATSSHIHRASERSSDSRAKHSAGKTGEDTQVDEEERFLRLLGRLRTQGQNKRGNKDDQDFDRPRAPTFTLSVSPRFTDKKRKPRADQTVYRYYDVAPALSKTRKSTLSTTFPRAAIVRGEESMKVKWKDNVPGPGIYDLLPYGALSARGRTECDKYEGIPSQNLLSSPDRWLAREKLYSIPPHGAFSHEFFGRESKGPTTSPNVAGITPWIKKHAMSFRRERRDTSVIGAQYTSAGPASYLAEVAADFVKPHQPKWGFARGARRMMLSTGFDSKGRITASESG